MWKRIRNWGYYIALTCVSLAMVSLAVSIEYLEYTTPVQATQDEHTFWSVEMYEHISDSDLLFSQHDAFSDGTSIAHTSLVQHDDSLLSRLQVITSEGVVQCNVPLKGIDRGLRIDFIRSIKNSHFVVNYQIPEDVSFTIGGQTYTNTTNQKKSVMGVFDTQCNLQEFVESIHPEYSFESNSIDVDGERLCMSDNSLIYCAWIGDTVETRIYKLPTLSRIYDITLTEKGVIVSADIGSQAVSFAYNNNSFVTKGRHVVFMLNHQMNQIEWFYSDENSIMYTLEYGDGMLFMAGVSIDDVLLGYPLPERSPQNIDRDGSFIAAFDVDKMDFAWLKNVASFDGSLHASAKDGLLYMIQSSRGLTIQAQRIDGDVLEVIAVNAVTGDFEYIQPLSGISLRHARLIDSGQLLISGQTTLNSTQWDGSSDLFWGFHENESYPKHIRCAYYSDSECNIKLI